MTSFNTVKEITCHEKTAYDANFRWPLILLLNTNINFKKLRIQDSFKSRSSAVSLQIILSNSDFDKRKDSAKMMKLYSFAVLLYAEANQIENVKCFGDNPRYYPGSTCQTYWLCHKGYQYPEERFYIYKFIDIIIDK